MNPRIKHLDSVLATVTAKLLSAYMDGHIDAVGEHIMANCLQSLYAAAFRHIADDRESGLNINDQAKGLPTFAEMDEFEIFMQSINDCDSAAELVCCCSEVLSCS